MLIVVPPLALLSLAVWFGLVDTPGIGEGRCSSCGVEDYVIAAHIVAAAAIAAAIAAASPGRRTRNGLVVVAALVALGLVVHDAFSVIAFATLIASFAVWPLVVGWWIWSLVRRVRATPIPTRQALWAAWACLVVLVPSLFAWTWIDRVNWLTF